LNENIRAYINYLKLEKIVNKKFGLDSIETKLLTELGIALEEAKELRVSDVLAMRDIASPATLHAALKRLLTRGLIVHIPQFDSRIKYIEITPLGWKRFTELAVNFA
jgi:DNA-binding MarR family transcriptional regulator